MIFVSIAAYKDTPDLIRTVYSALKAAKWPKQLVFGVVNQTDTPDADGKALKGYPVRLMQIPARDSLGVAWARSLVQQNFYDNEDYYLQIDSHMHFLPDWDEYLIDLSQSRANRKSIITAYPYGFSRNSMGITMDCEISEDTTLVMRPMPDQIFTQEDAAIRFESRHAPVRTPVLGCHLAAGFLFTTRNFVQEVPYDPQFYFHGEEQGLATRAWTRGWDLVHPPYIPVLHRYKKPDNPHAGHHWNGRDEQQVAVLQDRARGRLVDLVDGKLNGTIFGLGQDRTLSDFAAMSGLDYENRTVFTPDHLKDAFL